MSSRGRSGAGDFDTSTPVGRRTHSLNLQLDLPGLKVGLIAATDNMLDFSAGADRPGTNFIEIRAAKSRYVEPADQLIGFALCMYHPCGAGIACQRVQHWLMYG